MHPHPVLEAMCAEGDFDGLKYCLVTLGEDGLMLGSVSNTAEVDILHFPAFPLTSIVNCTGAGICLLARMFVVIIFLIAPLCR